MRRRDILKLYTTEYRTDSKTGKEKAVARYTGPLYGIEKKQRRSCAALCWAGWVMGAAAFVLAGLTPCWAQLCSYVAPFFILCLLPLFYLLLGAFKLMRLKEQFTEVDRADSFGYVQRSGLGLIVLGGAWVIATVVFLLLERPEMTLQNELIFLGCGVVSALSGALPCLGTRRVHLTSTANEKEAAEAACKNQ